jgi:hypothetical protein
MIQVGDGMRSLVGSCNKESMIIEGVSTASIAGDTMKGLFDHNQAHMCNLQDCFEFLLKCTLGHGCSYHQCSLGHIEPH